MKRSTPAIEYKKRPVCCWTSSHPPTHTVTGRRNKQEDNDHGILQSLPPARPSAPPLTPTHALCCLPVPSRGMGHGTLTWPRPDQCHPDLERTVTSP
ncbi:hypothetical protein Pmani_018031 [Petrolisthes manimaculis]|uniref:Uncharacterized protein n=1 Tax=Petrolisthes manimaculis TaxID=1843537 RepID=A0AAE1PLS9_9EUCA|nr:hypothetical protein Pmani_018031 [Petrolisthes manimaculis]